MIDSKKLLDQFLGAGASSTGSGQTGSLGGLGDMLNNALGGAGGAGGAGGLGDALNNALGSLTGGGQTGGSGGGGLGGLGDVLNNALGGLTGGSQSGSGGGLGGLAGQVTDFAKNNPGLSTVIAGGLASVLMRGKGPKLKTDALTLGGLAAIGTLAYKAYQQYKLNNPSAPEANLPSPSGPPATPPGTDDTLARSIIIAMIAAAKADGTVDETEKQKIVGKLAEGGLTQEEQAFLATEFAAPLDFNKVVALARGPEEAIQIYAASLLAITADNPAERAYLDMLAARLGIDAALKASIEQAVASAAA